MKLSAKPIDLFLLFTAAFFYFLSYGYRLNFPPLMYFDEVYFVPAARSIISLSGYTETTHPPLGKLLISLFIKILGDQPWIWRLPSLICSFGALVLVWKIIRQFKQSVLTASLACLFLAMDGLWMTQSRIALLNAPMLLLMLMSIWCFMKYHCEQSWTQHHAWLAGGLCAGFAMGTKWSAASVLAILAVWGYTHVQTSPLSLKQLRRILIYWILIPLAAYFSTFVLIPFIKGYSWMSIFTLQQEIPGHHLFLSDVLHRYASKWWTWPLMTRPIWYGFERHHPELPLDQQTVDGILCIGNPAIFWIIPISMAYIVWRFVKKRDSFSGLVLSGFIIQWAQAALVSRYTMFHHFYPAMPFAAMGLASFFTFLWNQSNSGWKIAVGFYFGITITMFIYWYPLWTGLTISQAAYQHHLWFAAWR